jgi:TPR repeat protein
MDDILKCCQTLGVEPGVSAKALKKAYRDLVKTWHPDRFHNSPKQRQEAEEKLKHINLAFERVQEYRASRPPQSTARPSRPSGTEPSAPFPKPKPPSVKPRPKPTPKPPARNATQPGAPKKTPPLEQSETTGQRWGRPVSITVAFAILLVLAVPATWLAKRKSPAPTSRTAEQPYVSIAELDRQALAARLNASNASARTTPALSAGSARPKLAEALQFTDGASRLDEAPGHRESLAPAEIRSAAIQELIKSRPSEKSVEANPPAEIPSPATEAQFQLGLRYAKGDDGVADYAEAVKWYRFAAEAGHAGAQKNLGLLFATGTGVPQDFTEAEKWLSQATAQGQIGADLVNAIIAIAKNDAERERVAQGEGLEPVSSNPAKESPKDQFERGLRYAKGDGVAQNFTEAAKWYRLAAEAGHGEAQHKLGFLYAMGRGVPMDNAEAEKWLGKAGAQGQIGADFANAIVALKKKSAVTNAPALNRLTNQPQPTAETPEPDPK